MKVTTVHPQKFSRITGQFSLRPRCRDILRSHDFSYRRLTDAEQEHTKILIRDATQKARPVDGADRKQAWEDCWLKNLSAYQLTPSEKSLVPDYLGAPYQRTLRLGGEFIIPTDPKFHLNFWRALRAQLFDRWLTWPEPATTVYELGSGSAWNLAAAREILPKVKCYGLDWSPSAVALASLVGNGGWYFNLRQPTPVPTPDKFSVVTCGALEQLGKEHEPLLTWLLQQKPSLCLHIEPLFEFYNALSQFDQLAVDYHTARGYLSGFVPAIFKLMGAGKVELLETRRVLFGGMYNEGYSYMVWRPR